MVSTATPESDSAALSNFGTVTPENTLAALPAAGSETEARTSYSPGASSRCDCTFTSAGEPDRARTAEIVDV